MTSAEQARSTILERVRPVADESVPLAQAYHRVIAKDIVSDIDIPPFNSASMDGFAVRSEDTRTASPGLPSALALTEEIAAGDHADMRLNPGSTARIMTGAPIPEGADAVVEQELTVTKNGTVEVQAPVSSGRNFRKRGEDIRAGSTVIQRGALIRPAHLGVLASLGVKSVAVHRRPQVAFLTTGNELVEVTDGIEGGKIRNSNAYALLGLIREAGAEPFDKGIARDTKDDLRRKLAESSAFDAMITSGGVSVGKYDLVLEMLREVGVEIVFWKVNIKPGMPFAFAVWRRESREIPVFCLPGNPVSTMVTFLQFVRPALKKMMGVRGPEKPVPLRAVLEHPITKSDGKRHWSRGFVRSDNGVLKVRTTRSQSSGVLTSLVEANCLVTIPEDARELREGDEVEVELLYL